MLWVRVACATLHGKMTEKEQRGEAQRLYWQVGISIRKIAEVLGRSRGWASTWAPRGSYKRRDVEDKPRPGRPRKVKPILHKAIKRMSSPKVTATEISRSLKQSGRADISASTVLRELKLGRVPKEWRPVVKSRHLRAASKAARLEFCNTTEMTDQVPWIFLDGKQLSLYDDEYGGLTYCWQRAGETLRKGSVKLVALYFFYGAVGRGFKSPLYFVPPSCEGKGEPPKSKETFKGEHFVGVMQQLAADLVGAGYGGRPHLIIRDRASQHVSKATVKALKPMRLPILESFPAQSWDINCIEHVWAQLAAAVKLRRPRSARGFKEVIKEEWQRVGQSTIDALVAGVPHRLRKIAELEGMWIAEYKG